MLALATLLACTGAVSTPAPEPAAPEVPEPPAAPVAPKDNLTKDADISGMSVDEKTAFLMKLGEKVYLTGMGGLPCVTCHGAEGKGMPGAFPPLVGQKDHMGDCAKHAGLVLDGMKGEIEVDGMKYNGVMVPQRAALNDLLIAAVITFERGSWGNDYGACLPEDVAKVREATK